jgi:predicted amidophosphoribosyltransferase
VPCHAGRVLRRIATALAPADLVAELAALLAPPACAACRAPVGARAGHLCPPCRRALPWLPRSACPRCALPAHGAAGCPAARAAFSSAWAPLAHAGPARATVAALKFHGALPVADAMAAAMAATAPRGLLAGATLVPVPAHAGRRRARGFDHAAALAAALGRRTGRPVAHALRRADDGRQLGAGRRQRLAADRLRVVARGPAPPVAVLVDDVHTTGATLSACARALRAAGAGDVRALTYARAL